MFKPLKFQGNWPLWVFWLGIFLMGALMAWNNSLTTSADLMRNQIEFKSWHPYVWEYSSFLSTFVLYFGIFWLARKKTLFSPQWLPHLLIHLLTSVLFSVLHVLSMVWLRQIVYYAMGGQYDFGDWWAEWLYEYRKDVITYFVFLLFYYAFDFFTQTSNLTSNTTAVKKIQVKNKQGTFWLNCADIVTIESGGNYIYFHAEGQVLPMRSTMTDIQQQLNSDNFIRVHRSYLVNLDYCKGIQKQGNETSELLLDSGKVVPISKKYRAELMAALQQKHLQAFALMSNVKM